MIELKTHPQGTILPVRAQAGARRSGIRGVRDGMLRVAVTAAPEKGKANQAIVALLGDTLSVPRSAIELLSGATATKKRFLIHGRSVDDLCKSLAGWLGSDQPNAD